MRDLGDFERLELTLLAASIFFLSVFGLESVDFDFGLSLSLVVVIVLVVVVLDIGDLLSRLLVVGLSGWSPGVG